MCSLSSFPPPPPKGQTTLCEVESCLIFSPPNTDIRNYTDKLLKYPNVKISSDILRPTVTGENVKNAFIHCSESLWKTTAVAWHERGVMGVLEHLSIHKEGYFLCGLSQFIAKRLIASLRWLHSLHGSIYPHLMLTNEELSQEYTATSNWQKGPVRAFAWHPYAPKCAVASLDDSVHIFTAESAIVPILKHKFQKGITDMGWKPYSASVLAVACHNGILIWQIDPTSLITRPSSNCMRLLSQKGHGPVTSIAWHPDGCLLASASAADTVMHIWDVCLEDSIPLQRYGGGGVSLLKWSPDGQRLLASTPSSLFRIWETQQWTCERWSKLAGRCQAACWSPDGSILLFTNFEEPTIYFLSFNSLSEVPPYSIGGSKLAVPVIDISEIFVHSENEELRVGGQIHQMVWDRKGERLAISFRDNNELIAIFRTKLKPALEISSCGFVRGLPGEYALLMNFHDGFTDGALLTVCWSSGRISHIPFLFVSVSDTDMSVLGLQLASPDLSSVQRRKVLFSDT